MRDFTDRLESTRLGKGKPESAIRLLRDDVMHLMDAVWVGRVALRSDQKVRLLRMLRKKYYELSKECFGCFFCGSSSVPISGMVCDACMEKHEVDRRGYPDPKPDNAIMCGAVYEI